MHRALNTFLLWLLIAALPFQGFAAAVQASCATTAHHASAQMTAPAQSDAGHEHHASPAHHEDAASATGDAAEAEHSAVAKHQSSSCSACASCCVGASAPPCLSISSLAYGSSQAVVSSPAPLVTGFIPAGLERPPKRISA